SAPPSVRLKSSQRTCVSVEFVSVRGRRVRTTPPLDDGSRIVYSRSGVPAKRRSLKYGGDSPRATDWSWTRICCTVARGAGVVGIAIAGVCKGAPDADRPPSVTAAMFGMTWNKPSVVLPNDRAAVLDCHFAA